MGNGFVGDVTANNDMPVYEMIFGCEVWVVHEKGEREYYNDIHFNNYSL